MDQSGKIVITLADESALLSLSSPPSCQIELTSIKFDFAGSGGSSVVTPIQVSGVAWGPTQVEVQIESPLLTAPVAKISTVGASQKWTATLSLASQQLPYGSVVSISATSTDPTVCDASTSKLIHLMQRLGSAAVLRPEPGVPAGFEEDRNRYVSGHVDRLIPSASFTPMLCSFSELPYAGNWNLAKIIANLGIGRGAAMKLVDTMFSKVGKALKAQAAEAVRKRKVLNIQDVYRTIDTALANFSVEPTARKLKKLSKDKRQRWLHAASVRLGVDVADLIREYFGQPAKMKLTVVEARLPGSYTLVRPGRPGKGASAGTSAKLATMANIIGAISNGKGGGILGIKPDYIKYLGLGWLGIMHFDRLRLRPSGIVAGEHVYSLALAPGEEVTLTQRSETKKSTSFEEVLDKSAEQELQFSSTWSTDLTQGTSDQFESGSQTDVGFDLGLKVQVVNIGFNVGHSSSESSTITKESQVARGTSVTRSAASRLRSEHKTTFKLGTDLTEEFGSKRQIRNFNPSRAQILNFFKLHQKYRIYLERYDAKLCISLTIRDPGRDARKELDAELMKLNPPLDSDIFPQMPSDKVVNYTRYMENTSHEGGGTEIVASDFRVEVPAGYLVSGITASVTRYWVDVDDTGNIEEFSGSDYVAEGGYVNVTTGFSGDPVYLIGRTEPFMLHIYASCPELDGEGWWTTAVEANIEVRFSPADQTTKDAQDKVDAKRKEIQDSFSMQRVASMVDEVRASEPDMIFKRLFSDVFFAAGYIDAADPPASVVADLQQWFDWENMSVEYLPWWLTADGRMTRDEYRQKLLALPGDTRSDLIMRAFLVASYARVYLPINAGCETNVVSLLTRGNTASFDAPIADFTTWRDANLSAISYTLPTAQDVMRPLTSLGTPAGSSSWAGDWEKLRRNFFVLGEWTETVPTDGVHVEPALSTCEAPDAYRASALMSELENDAARREVQASRASLERELVGNSDSPTVVLGDMVPRTA